MAKKTHEPTLGEYVLEALRTMPIDYETPPHRVAFDMARRAITVLWKVGKDDRSPRDLLPIVRTIAEEQGFDYDELARSFESAWYKVRLYEGHDSLSHPYSLALREWQERPEPLSTEFATEGQTRHAQLIAATGRLLQERNEEETGIQEFFIPTRKMGDLLEMSHEYVAELIQDLVADGTFVILKKHTPGQSTRYKYAPLEARQPRVDRRSGRNRRNKRIGRDGRAGELGLEIGTSEAVPTTRRQGYFKQSLDEPIRLESLLPEVLPKYKPKAATAQEKAPRKLAGKTPVVPPAPMAAAAPATEPAVDAERLAEMLRHAIAMTWQDCEKQKLQNQESAERIAVTVTSYFTEGRGDPETLQLVLNVFDAIRQRTPTFHESVHTMAKAACQLIREKAPTVNLERYALAYLQEGKKENTA